MKRLLIASLLASAWLGAQAETYTDHARVRSAEPQYENIKVPRQVCRSHWVDEREGRFDRAPQSGPDRGYGGALVGGLAGGVIGHQVGGGSGKDVATALGVVLGAMAGDHLQNKARSPYDNRSPAMEQREVQRCHTVYDTEPRLTGYQVAYDYRGQNYTTFMKTDPGNRLAVRVSVTPILQ